MTENTKEEAVVVEGLSKSFKLPYEKTTSIKGLLVNFWRRKKGYEKFNALEDISFTVKKGEFFGIIGSNGSGKSTLLKLMAGIYSPDKGSVIINGKLTPFIELGVGFSPELTGKENVYLNGALLGFSRKEMQKLYKDIVEFAELERFMDQKLKNYSSGMQVRLAFSIAIRAQPDILLIDEVLAVGDVAFQEKCFEVFRDIKSKGKTVIFVSHDLSSVQEFCDRVLFINKGKQMEIGEAEKLTMDYQTLMAEKSETAAKPINTDRPGTGKARVVSAELFDSKKQATKTLKENESFTIRVNYKLNNPMKAMTCGISINDNQGISIMGPNTLESHYEIGGKLLSQEGFIEAYFDKNPLSPAVYTVSVGLFNEQATQPHDFFAQSLSFKVIGKARHGKINIIPQWTAKVSQ